MQQATQPAAEPIIEWVRIPLTTDELLTRADELTNLLREAQRLKDEQKDTASEFRRLVKIAEAKMVVLTREIAQRAAMVRSECDVVLNHPRHGVKSIIAKATQEVVRTEPMTDSDRQAALWPQ